jgi:hypothetical protein
VRAVTWSRACETRCSPTNTVSPKPRNKRRTDSLLCVCIMFQFEVGTALWRAGTAARSPVFPLHTEVTKHAMKRRKQVSGEVCSCLNASTQRHFRALTLNEHLLNTQHNTISGSFLVLTSQDTALFTSWQLFSLPRNVSRLWNPKVFYLPHLLYLLGFQNKILYAFHITSMRATSRVHPPLFDLPAATWGTAYTDPPPPLPALQLWNCVLPTVAFLQGTHEAFSSLFANGTAVKPNRNPWKLFVPAETADCVRSDQCSPETTEHV